MRTKDFEEFVASAGKFRGITVTREQYARMNELREKHIRFAVILSRWEGKSCVEIKPHPGDERAHVFATIMFGNMRSGNLVLYVMYGIKDDYVVLCTRDNWTRIYQRIVEPKLRPREAHIGFGSHYKRKERPEWVMPIPRQRFTPTDREPERENPYRKQNSKHSVTSAQHSALLMHCYGAITA